MWLKINWEYVDIEFATRVASNWHDILVWNWLVQGCVKPYFLSMLSNRMKWFQHERWQKSTGLFCMTCCYETDAFTILSSFNIAFCIQTMKSVWIERNTGHRRQTTTAYWMSIHNVNVDCAYAQQNFSIQCNQDTVWPFVKFVNGIKSAFSLHVFAKSMSASYLLIQ